MWYSVALALNSKKDKLIDHDALAYHCWQQCNIIVQSNKYHHSKLNEQHLSDSQSVVGHNFSYLSKGYSNHYSDLFLTIQQQITGNVTSLQAPSMPLNQLQFKTESESLLVKLLIENAASNDTESGLTEDDKDPTKL